MATLSALRLTLHFSAHLKLNFPNPLPRSGVGLQMNLTKTSLFLSLFLFLSLPFPSLSFAGLIKHIHSAVAHRVLPAAGGNHSAHVAGGAAARQICALHNDTGYVQVSACEY